MRYCRWLIASICARNYDTNLESWIFYFELIKLRFRISKVDTRIFIRKLMKDFFNTATAGKHKFLMSFNYAIRVRVKKNND